MNVQRHSTTGTEQTRRGSAELRDGSRGFEKLSFSLLRLERPDSCAGQNASTLPSRQPQNRVLLTLRPCDLSQELRLRPIFPVGQSSNGETNATISEASKVERISWRTYRESALDLDTDDRQDGSQSKLDRTHSWNRLDAYRTNGRFRFGREERKLGIEI